MHFEFWCIGQIKQYMPPPHYLQIKYPFYRISSVTKGQKLINTLKYMLRTNAEDYWENKMWYENKQLKKNTSILFTKYAVKTWKDKRHFECLFLSSTWDSHESIWSATALKSRTIKSQLKLVFLEGSVIHAFLKHLSHSENDPISWNCSFNVQSSILLTRALTLSFLV